VPLLILLLLCQHAAALEITALDRSSGVVEFSEKIEITSVRFSTDAFGGAVALPISNSRDGREFANIRIMNKNLYGKMMTNADRPCAEDCQYPAVKVISARKLKPSARIANVEISFDGELAVTFGLLKARTKSGGVSYRMLTPDNFKFKFSALRKSVRELVIEAGIRAEKDAQPERQIAVVH
jgi:hypothetical protein